MNLCDPSEVRTLLDRHGFHFSKDKGQNFLIDSSVPKKIVAYSGIDCDTCVLEIGPGIGPLTNELCLHAKQVTAVEIDRSLEPILAETLAGHNNLHVIFGDILKQNIPELVCREFGEAKPAACANLPYYITSPILSALLESRAFNSVTVMVQKEVAERICSAPGSSDYSAFTVFCNYYSTPEKLFDVSPECFLPRPKVTSSVIKLTLRAQPVCGIDNESLFFKVVKASFAVRRKTLLNGLAMGFPMFSKAVLSDVLQQCGFDPSVRGETLGIPEFAAIANKLHQRIIG